MVGVFFYFQRDHTETLKQNNQTIIQEIVTDQAAYSPGESVNLSVTLDPSITNGALFITYYHLDEILLEKEIPITDSNIQWNWVPPQEDYKGYLVKVSYESTNLMDTKTIAVDVSSDWSKFPRYGFLSKFDSIPLDEMQETMDKLNRFHLNGLQFYDWHYKHHEPIPMDGRKEWQDIANRQISLDTVKQYIALAHEKNMKTMSYNLLYGAFKEAEIEGVESHWRLFKDSQHDQHDVHPLPSDWKSDVYLVNPHDESWQNYMMNRQKELYESLPFDGWHIDQLGDRGTVYNYNGELVDIASSFERFLSKIKNATPEKGIVMNSVNQYGQSQITNAPVDFLYTEVWDEYKTYLDLNEIIQENMEYSNGSLSTVLAAYMNYEHSNETGNFNTSGILLTNSVIFASGGAHLELGEHMLSKEYFPHNKLDTTKELNKQLIAYYDFLVAYENLLRDDVEEEDMVLSSPDWASFSSSPELGKIWSFAKKKETKKIIHLINFYDATSLDWRDTEGQQPEPQTRDSFQIKISVDKPIKKVWMASPDRNLGEPEVLEFHQEEGNVTVRIPSLNYWNMIVVE
ncbi:hypothetical protein Q75_07420 [Bacillus coahuilensis p1.1.43]|uniref:Cycloisomaltooligosaccharide glucanotransferase n=1 Tax=Bacillus coahuilensis p1.1.43 TaxID=1150625 RepID=A0A147K8V5_9BACI|nr:hypothetical protein Q75_07420 [Bacillus coahuilensis p1.1.43]